MNININESFYKNQRMLLPIHPEITQKLDRFICSNKIPHILFHGPSGSCKLTLVKQFLAKIYRHDTAKMKSHVMIVNCSHGKGIQFIRDEIKFFAKTNIHTKSCAEFKTIVLLNAHHLTADAQSALRRCIEQFSYNTRFFIVVENKNKLLTPILSRFCDLYVPECNGPNGLNGNMHQYVLDRAFPFRAELKEEKRRILESVLGKSGSVMDTATELYENGVSCLDVMECIRDAGLLDHRIRDAGLLDPKRDAGLLDPKRDAGHSFSSTALSELEMRFHTMKTEFRCEKLLMLFLLTELHG